MNIKYIKEKIINWWFNLKEQYKQYYQDKKAKKLFPKVIEEENNDRESLFNQFNLRTTDNFTKVVYVIDIPEEYQLKGQQWQIMDKLNETSFFISKYLRDNLGFKNNIKIPTYYHIEDPTENNPFSCRYLAVWEISPVLESKKTIYTINSIITTLILTLISSIIYFII